MKPRKLKRTARKRKAPPRKVKRPRNIAAGKKAARSKRKPRRMTDQLTTASPDAPAKTNSAAVWNGKMMLRKPVVANGESVNEIEFREPTGGDIERIGNPVTVGIYENNPKVHFESAVMTAMMAHLAGVPPSTIRSMHPKDWNNGAWKLADFFMPDL